MDPLRRPGSHADPLAAAACGHRTPPKRERHPQPRRREPLLAGPPHGAGRGRGTAAPQLHGATDQRNRSFLPGRTRGPGPRRLPELPVSRLARSPPEETVSALKAGLLSFLFPSGKSGQFAETLGSVVCFASVVRDRLSLDIWRIANQLNLDLLFPWPKDRVRPGDVLLVLNHALNLLSALSGLGMESMTRGPGWRFMDMGRRIERAFQTLWLLQRTLVGQETPSQSEPPELSPLLEAILEVADSSMTYRYRYLTSLQLAPLLDLLLVDETNPRSVGFQLAALSEHACAFAGKQGDPL